MGFPESPSQFNRLRRNQSFWLFCCDIFQMIRSFKNQVFAIGFLETPSLFRSKIGVQNVIDFFEVDGDFDWVLIFCLSPHRHPRHLDADLSTVMRAAEVFDWKRINFVLEASCLIWDHWFSLLGQWWKGQWQSRTRERDRIECFISNLFLTDWQINCSRITGYQIYQSNFGPKLSKVRGKSLEEFVAQSQDRSRNALQKSLEAAFSAWLEQLRTDQTQFESERILPLGCIFHWYVLSNVYKTILLYQVGSSPPSKSFFVGVVL